MYIKNNNSHALFPFYNQEQELNVDYLSPPTKAD